MRNETPLPLIGRRILIVEDEYVIAAQLACWLREAGAEVIGPVPDTGRALHHIQNSQLDAAVLDINLGDGRTSFLIADRLEALGVPYLFATGETRKDPASNAGAPPRLSKPTTKIDLMRALDCLMANARRNEI